jgi:hypothetical protein
VTTDVRVVVIGKAVVRVVPPWIIVLRTVSVCTMGVSLLVKVWTTVAVVGKSTVVVTVVDKRGSVIRFPLAVKTPSGTYESLPGESRSRPECRSNSR